MQIVKHGEDRSGVRRSGRRAGIALLLGMPLLLAYTIGCPLLGGFSLPPITSDVEIGLELLVSGLGLPVALVEVPDGSGRLFIVEHGGSIRILLADGMMLPQPFLDVTPNMVTQTPFDERGLLSLAFHPDYADNGRFFVSYNVPLDSGDPPELDCRLRFSEFLVSPGDPNTADAASETILQELVKEFSIHSAGQLSFGPDGMLYVGIGDGGADHDHADHLGGGIDSAANDIEPDLAQEIGRHGQDTTNLFGTILRYDADTPGQWIVPPDNPFVGNPDVADPIYAYGFRNPWRMTFDMGGAHRLFSGDVGENFFEEVNIVIAGGNYGWNMKEGFSCFDQDAAFFPPVECPDVGARGEPLLDPILDYAHSDVSGALLRTAVIGGYVYRGSQIPQLFGQYIFGDLSPVFGDPDGKIFVASEDAAGQWTFTRARITTEANGKVNRRVLAFGQTLDGEVYVLTALDISGGGTTGEVLEIVVP